MPVALPGARGVLFQLCGSSCVTMSIHVLDIRTGKEKLLLDDVAQAWYLPSGHLLYVRRDGVALVAPFDLGRFVITGAATPVLEGVQVTVGGGFALLTWSPSGSLVYGHGAGGSTDNAMIRVGRDGAITQIDEYETAVVSPRIYPAHERHQRAHVLPRQFTTGMRLFTSVHVTRPLSD